MINSSILLITFYGLMVLCLVLLVYWFIRIVVSRRDLLMDESELIKRESKILDEARRQAKMIVEDAKLSVDNLKSTREEFLKMYVNKLDQMMSQVSQKESEELGKRVDIIKNISDRALTNANDEFVKIVNDVNLKIKNDFESLVASYLEEIHLSSEKNIDDLRLYQETARQNIDKEMSLYRQNLMKDIQNSVLSSVKELSVKIFGQTLSNENHEDLVRKAIDQAKKEGLFN